MFLRNHCNDVSKKKERKKYGRNQDALVQKNSKPKEKLREVLGGIAISRKKGIWIYFLRGMEKAGRKLQVKWTGKQKITFRSAENIIAWQCQRTSHNLSHNCVHCNLKLSNLIWSFTLFKIFSACVVKFNYRARRNRIRNITN